VSHKNRKYGQQKASPLNGKCDTDGKKRRGWEKAIVACYETLSPIPPGKNEADYKRPTGWDTVLD
jgi:hypothetical protein